MKPLLLLPFALHLSSLLCPVHSSLKPASNSASSLGESSSSVLEEESSGLNEAACRGKRVFVHDLPPQFNIDLLYDKSKDPTVPDWCKDCGMAHLFKAALNRGFGKPMPVGIGAMGLSQFNGTWFNTDHSTLETIFYYRMASYKCRVKRHQDADLIYVPYFGAHDSLRNMHKDVMTRDRLAVRLLSILVEHPAWSRSNGSNHFWVLGGPVWDFFRKEGVDWGSSLLSDKRVWDNMWTVVTEKGEWQPRINSSPWPTGFHPQTQDQVQEWQSFVRSRERTHLFGYAAGRRSSTSRTGAVREKLFWQCESAEEGACGLVDCSKATVSCLDIKRFFGLYLSSSFCMHPRGDACTRRSLIDAALAGCIPVVFADCSLRWQYQWHLGNHLDGPGQIYVYIPEESLMQEGDDLSDPSKVLVEDVLRKIPPKKVEAMRNNVINLIPRLTYGGKVDGDRILAPDFEDGIDVIVNGIARGVRRVIKQKQRQVNLYS